MDFIRGLLDSKRTVLLALLGFAVVLWLATALSLRAGSTLFIVLFGLTALCVSIYAGLYAILSGGPSDDW